MIDLDSIDHASLLTEEQAIDFLKLHLGEKSVTRYNAGYYVFMNDQSPDIELRPGLRLKQLASHDRYGTTSYIRVRLIADLMNIYDVLGGGFTIVEAFKTQASRSRESKYEEDWHKSGNAVDIKPLKKSGLRDLIRVARFVKQKGGRGFYPDYIHLDCGYNKTWTVGKSKKAD